MGFLTFAVCLYIGSVLVSATNEQHKYKNHFNLKCQAGQYEAMYRKITKSTCVYPVTSEAECKKAAQFNKKYGIDNNNGFGGSTDTPADPYGCFHNKGYNGKYFFNYHKSSPKQCTGNEKSCICDHVSCHLCPRNTYSSYGKTCKSCPKERPMSIFEKSVCPRPFE